ncbi:IS66 family element, transposase domain protein [Leptospira inadai serovar Lyme str. 10]|uniref:IS66 family element, transposase domain protein n=1 Tax=Leptospira inadai serovar Lyme str. 10 TaxID=1049790 RepID=V6HKG4_9LEPT|nr:transposase [Leptospira inadai]EQA37370.1 IS66 family element, transposase domain protein [Leptospira inadai serovar Lyme str. 10]
MTNKFVDHLPFYRMEKIFRRMDLELPRSTMCNWTKQVYERSTRSKKKFENKNFTLCVYFQRFKKSGKKNQNLFWMI